MIKYGKLVCISLTVLFVLCGALLIRAAPPGISTQYAAVYSIPPASVTGELLEGETVNVNTSDKAALMRIPGIGEVLAERIIDYREEHGSIESLDELINVKGVGEATLQKLRPYMRVN